MPRRRRIPKYRHYKPKDLAVVRIDGKDHYLGRYESSESWEKYHRLVAEWFSRPSGAPPAKASPEVDQLTINGLIFLYWEYAKGYYVDDEGEPTQELNDMRLALRPLRKLYGKMLATEFGPKKLKLVRQHMIDVEDLSRGVVNHRTNRIKRVFRWATEEELVPSSIYHGLQAVAGLRYGKTRARETEPVRQVEPKWIEATLPYVARQVSTMIQLQRLGGMRPGEVVRLRFCEIDMSGDVWIYRLDQHKNRWRGHKRQVALGPRCQKLLRPFLDRDPEAFLFSPKEAETERNATRRANRKTPMTPSQRRRRPNRKPKRAKRDHYDRDSYRRAIEYGITRANRKRPEDDQIPKWCPLQIRHTRGTEVRRKHGLDGAQATLGQKHASITEVYAELELERAIEIARDMG